MKKLIPIILICLLIISVATYTSADLSKDELINKRVMIVYQGGSSNYSIKCIILDIIPVHYSVLIKVKYNGAIEYFPLSNISLIKEIHK